MSSVKLQGEKFIMKEDCWSVTMDYSMGALRVHIEHECNSEDDIEFSAADEGDGLRALEKLEAFAQGHIMDEHLNRSGVDF